MREVLQFQPLYQERVWGGQRLRAFLGRDLPGGSPIGESWEIVDRPEAQSRVSGGRFSGLTLRELVADQGKDLLGPTWTAARPFPLLVKWLDCSDRLSLQVHPPADVAASMGGEPKTENWYVAQSVPGASLFVGLKSGVKRAAFAKALATDTAEDCVNNISVASGDSILVRSGQVHAIDAGNLILEIQQNSDTTFRLYDWGRKGLDGKPRQLHVDESLRSIRWDEEPPDLVRAAPTSGVIASCDEFTIRRVVLGPNEPLRFRAGEQPRILSVVAGALTTEASEPDLRPLPLGSNVLVPWSAEVEFLAPEASIVLVTERFGVRFAVKSLIVLGGSLALLALAWMVFLPRVVEHELRSITGFDFKVVVLTANPLTGSVVVRGLSVRNPSDFPKPEFVLLRELSAQVELFPLLTGKRVLDKFDLTIETIVLVRRHDGKTNAGVFMAALSPSKPAGAPGPVTPPAPTPPPKAKPYLIKRLHLALDTLVVADYSGQKPDEKTYKLHIDRIYNNVTSGRQLLVPDVMATLRSFGLRHDVTSLLPGDMGKLLAGALGDAAQVGGGVKDAVKKAGQGLKGFFEKLEQTPKQ